MTNTRPNFLFILSDDHGAWAMGCAGNKELKTPNLDRLADMGVRFENFFALLPFVPPRVLLLCVEKCLPHTVCTIGLQKAIFPMIR